MMEMTHSLHKHVESLSMDLWSTFSPDHTPSTSIHLYLSLSLSLPPSPSVLALVADLIGDEAVFPGLEVGLVQAAASVDHLLILRGSLAIVLSAASARLVAGWVLQNLRNVHLLLQDRK